VSGSIGVSVPSGRSERRRMTDRLRVFFRTQCAFSVAVALLLVLVAVHRPSLETAMTVCAALGVGVAAAATAASILAPWERIAPRWLIALPIADLVAVALLGDALAGRLPIVFALILFPVLWIAYGFSSRVLPIAIVGIYVLCALPVLSGDFPSRRLALLVFVPTILSLVAVSVHLAARDTARTYADRHLVSTELRRMLDESNDQATIVRAVADAVDVGIIVFDTQDRPQLQNRVVGELMARIGFNPATGTADFVYGADKQTQAKKGRNILLETLEGSEGGRVYWVGPEGDQRAIITNSHRITRPEGDFLGSAIVVYDVTDLANAIKIREEFLASVSHELRTPLTSIVGYLDVIEELYHPAEMGMGVEFEIVQRNAEQLLTLIGDLLAASSGELPLRIESVDLAALAEISLDALQLRAEAAGLRLQRRLPESLMIEADPGRVRQVLDNILSNAVKYTPAGGTVTVALDGTDGEAVLRVEDTGDGISPEDLRQVFERFFRARSARDGAIQGVGLGLSIVKTIVDAHHGHVDVTSALGIGSTFVVRLPVVQAEDPGRDAVGRDAVGQGSARAARSS
jgi:signal transduction histidine kinase